MAQAVTPSKTAIKIGAFDLPPEVLFGHQLPSGPVNAAHGVLGCDPQHLRPFYQVDVRHDYFPTPRRTGKADLGIASDDDGVGVVPEMGPTPQRRFTQEHERCDVVDHIVRPLGPERSAVPVLVPPRVADPP